ncbi:hypothetical protein ACOMHN_057072 [Nucella lapillus]
MSTVRAQFVFGTSLDAVDEETLLTTPEEEVLFTPLGSVKDKVLLTTLEEEVVCPTLHKRGEVLLSILGTVEDAVLLTTPDTVAEKSADCVTDTGVVSMDLETQTMGEGIVGITTAAEGAFEDSVTDTLATGTDIMEFVTTMEEFVEFAKDTHVT